MIDMENLKIVFFGTPEFAAYSLDALLGHGADVRAVVTMPDKIAGRGHKLISSDVKKYAESRGLKVLQPANLKSEEFHNQLKELNADLFIVIAFRMLPEKVWAMPRLGTFNLHASLLPDYRGAAPINHAVINGETKTGVTTFFLKHDIDEGNIIMQRSTEILPEDNAGDVHDRLMKIGADLVLQTVDAIRNGTADPRPQPEGDFRPAPKIFKNDCRIDWKRDCESIHNLVRGLSPYPGAWSELLIEGGNSLNVKIFTTAPTERERGGMNAGDVAVEGKRLFVATAERLLEIKELQPAGKGRMEASAFLHGYRPVRFE